MQTFPSLKEETLVILCGGKSSRMGEDKALLPFSSYNSLSQYQYERLKPYFKEVYLSAKNNKFGFLKDDEIIFDDGETASPMVALQSILKKVQSNRVFILTVDTPFVSLETIQKLYDESNLNDITVASASRLHSLCGVFSKSVLKTVEECIKQDIHKIGYLLKNVNTHSVIFKNDEEFLNLNHPEEYQEALSKLS